MRLWLKFCVVWAVFSLVWGPLTGPDTWRDRFIHALVPVILFVVSWPILHNLQFLRIYREYGWRGVIVQICIWVFILWAFSGFDELFLPTSWHAPINNFRIWMLVYMLRVIPGILLLGWLARTAFKGLRWLVRALFPQSSSPTAADNHPREL